MSGSTEERLVKDKRRVADKEKGCLSRNGWLGQEKGGLDKRRVARTREGWLGQERGG